MKFKRKIAGLLAALMVLTLGSVTALADTYDSPSAGDYDSPSADDYYKVRETIEPGMIYVATGTDSKTPWVTIEGTEQVKNLDASVTKALAYKSTKNPNQATEIIVYGADTLSAKISKENMATLASRDGYLIVNSKAPSKWDSKYANTYCGKLYMHVKNGKALDFSVIVKNNSKVDAKLKEANYTENAVQFSVGGVGKLPGVASIDYFSDDYKGNAMNMAYIYYYNPIDNKLEYVGMGDVAENGTGFYTYGSIIANSGSYVFVKKELPKTVTSSSAVVNVAYENTDADITDADITKSATDKINSADKGDTVKITNIPSKLKVEQKVFEAAKAKGVSLCVDSSNNNATFRFSNFDKVSEMSGAFDPTVTIGKSVVKAIDTTMANSKVPYLTVSFAYDGKLPGKTEVALDLSEGGFKDGATVYLYYFNEKTNAFELVDEAKYADGFATFEMEHCSDYIVTAEKLSSSAPATVSTPKATPASKGTAAKNPKTGDTTPIIPLVVVMFVGIAAVVVAFYRKKRA